MSACAPADTLYRYLDSALAADEMTAVVAHLTACPACRKVVDRLLRDPALPAVPGYELHGVVGKGGMGTLYVNDKKVATGRIERTQPGVFSADETADVGIDLASPVVESIGAERASKFTGKIEQVTVQVAPLSPDLEHDSRDVAVQRIPRIQVVNEVEQGTSGVALDEPIAPRALYVEPEDSDQLLGAEQGVGALGDVAHTEPGRLTARRQRRTQILPGADVLG